MRFERLRAFKKDLVDMIVRLTMSCAAIMMQNRETD